MFTQEEIKRLLDIASYGSHKGKTLAAREIFETILFFNPKHSGALLGLAFNHITVNEFDKAEKIINDVLEKNSNDTEAKGLLGLSYFLSDRTEEARKIFEEIKSSDGSSKTLAENLLNIL